MAKVAARETGTARPPLGPPLVVIPTYCESGNIESLLRLLRQVRPDATVLVVDDEGGDGTADLVEAMAAGDDHVELLRRTTKAGLASAYKEGFRWGIDQGFEVIVGMDADLSHDPTSLPLLLGALDDGADVAIGSRYVAGGSTAGWSLFRRAISRLGNWYAAMALKVEVGDLTSAYRAYRVDALCTVDLERLEAGGYGFLMELLFLLRAQEANLREVPIIFSDRTLGKSKMSARIALESLVVVTRVGIRSRLVRGDRHR